MSQWVHTRFNDKKVKQMRSNPSRQIKQAKHSQRKCMADRTFIILLIVIALTVPLIVNVAFSINAPIGLLEARFATDGLLQYFGTVAIGIGTISLAWLSYRQADKIESVRAEMQDKQAQFERLNTKRPFFAVAGISLDGQPLQSNVDDFGVLTAALNDDTKNIGVNVVNIGDGPACKCRTCDDAAFGEAPIERQHRVCIPSGEQYNFEVLTSSIKQRGNQDITIKYENILGCEFAQSLTILYIEDLIYSDEVEAVDEGRPVAVPSGASESISVSELSEQRVSKTAKG